MLFVSIPQLPCTGILDSKNGVEVGMIALEVVEEGVVELSLTISPAHRYTASSLEQRIFLAFNPLAIKRSSDGQKRNSWKRV